MVNEVEKYERLITESPIFQLNKEEEYNAYRQERYKMIENLYLYLKAINKGKYEQCGCEITEVAMRCIENYDSAKGVFLYYFKRAINKELSHVTGDEIIDDKFHGLKVTENEKRDVIRYIQFFKKVGKNKSQDEIYELAAETMSLTVERVKYIAQMSEVSVSGEEYMGEDGTEQSMWDIIYVGSSIEADLEDAENLFELLNVIENEYSKLQDRQKPLISDLMTIKICRYIDEDISKYSFVNTQLLEEYFSTGNLPTQRDIAEKYSRNEASVSRTIKDFLSKLQGEL